MQGGELHRPSTRPSSSNMLIVASPRPCPRSRPCGFWMVSQEKGADFAERFFVRVLPLPGAITKCIDAGFSPSHVIGMQGPFTRELNEAMLRQVGAQWLVTKDSGTVGGTAEKLAAARDAGARCIVVARPAEGGGALSLREVEDALLREFAR